MKLNCKPGDLAILVRSSAGNEGKIVTCLRIATQDEMDCWMFDSTYSPAWITDQRLKASNGIYMNIVPDEFLRPIRDKDGEDETITWAGKPQEVTA